MSKEEFWTGAVVDIMQGLLAGRDEPEEATDVKLTVEIAADLADALTEEFEKRFGEKP